MRIFCGICVLVCLVAGLTVCIAAENLRRVLAQTLVIVGNCRAQRFLCQHGAVHLYRRQTVQSLSNGLVGQLERFLQALALTISVAIELVAIAAPQPKVLNLTSSMMPSSDTLR